MSKLLIGSLLLTITTSTFAAGWNNANNPALMAGVGEFAKQNLKIETNFNTLPIAGDLAKEKTAWPDTYWPTYQGGIANRFIQDYDKVVTIAKLHSKEEILKMSEEDLAKLSPAEKFDIANQRYDYPLTKMEISRTESVVKNPKDKEWFGLCHGWAPAALNYEEPGCPSIANNDGVKVPFNSADVKALLTYFTGQVCPSAGNACFVGGRCNVEKANMTASEKSQYDDINPGSFHVILSNLIGRAQQGFVMDKTASLAVWNQPVVGYESKVISSSDVPASTAASATKKEVTVHTKVKWVRELGPLPIPVTITIISKDEYILEAEYDYVLELDQNNKIVGGRWLGKSADDHPDFVWHKNRVAFSKYPGWGLLDKIYTESLAKKKSLPKGLPQDERLTSYIDPAVTLEN
ncbi:MAG: hypothetical protein HQK50_18830 [Oligoflexia bacterium]|nr:hypothetical protein [Oligoflexia bacterium]